MTANLLENNTNLLEINGIWQLQKVIHLKSSESGSYLQGFLKILKGNPLMFESIDVLSRSTDLIQNQ